MKEEKGLGLPRRRGEGVPGNRTDRKPLIIDPI